MHDLIYIIPLLPAALSAAPLWVPIMMAAIVVILIILLYKELWAFFTKLETGIILLIILTLLSIVGGLLPQHLTQADVADELLGLSLPDVVEPSKAAQLMEKPAPGDVPPAMVAQIMGLPSPETITPEDAAHVMGINPPPGMPIQQAYSNWLNRVYAQKLIGDYGTWFNEQVNAREQPFKTFYKIGFFRIYHTWYYLVVAYLLFITVVCCTINRIIGWAKTGGREPRAWAEERLLKQPESAQFKAGPGEAADASKTAEILKNAGFNPKACAKDGSGYQFSMNFGFKFPFVLSSSIFHFAIFLALLGFLSSSYYSWRDSIMINVGESAEIHLISPEMKMYKWWDSVARNRGWEWAKPDKRYNLDASFQVRCNDYFSEFKPDDTGWYTLTDYKSDLTIVDNGQEMKTKIIEVNFPLQYKGIDLFQENVDESAVLKITAPDGQTYETQATIWGTKFPSDAGIDPTIKATSLVWGHLLDETGGFSELSPMIRVGKILPPKKEEWPNPGKPKSQGMGMGMMGMGVTETDWLFTIEADKPYEWNGYTFLLSGPYTKATGLQVVHDPGVPILWVSIVIMIVMMVLRVYFPYYTARVDYKPEKDGGRLLIAGRGRGITANFMKRAEGIARMVTSKGTPEVPLDIPKEGE